jgi:hypothetical protein
MDAEPCLACGASNTKRWQLPRGAWVCDECWLDTAMDEQAQHWRVAKEGMTRQAGQPVIHPRSMPTPELKEIAVQVPVRSGSSLGSGLTRQPNHTATGAYRKNGARGWEKGSPFRHGREPDDYRCKVKWREAAEEVLKHGTNSVCAICSRIYYGAKIECCPRCGGLCAQTTDHGLELMGRRAVQVVERGEE